MGPPKPSLFRRLRSAFFKKVSDRRKYTRVPISVKVTNLTSGNFTYYLALNIGIGGMFIKADEPLALDTPLTLQFSLPERGPIEIKAVVVRIQQANPELGIPSGMGVKFTQATGQARQSIDTFVELKM